MSAGSIAYTLVPSPEHAFPGHPESPERFRFFDRLQTGELSEHLRAIPARPAAEDAITSVHTMGHLQAIREAARQGPRFVDYGDTYVAPSSCEAALLAAGGTIAMLEAILAGDVDKGFALVRPPGHHATQNQAMGFCLFNNIAIATRQALRSGCARVMIVDFDVHHGNGTQDIFYEDGDVLYVSTHQRGIYPGSGYAREVGAGSGEGTTINIPLPGGAGDRAFQMAIEQVILPAGERFKPDLLLISAGFDAHWCDPLAGLQLSTSGYYEIASRLRALAEKVCGGRMLFTLEGGYDPRGLAENVGAVLRACAGLAPGPDQLGPAPRDEPDIGPLISEIRSIHSLS